MMKQLFYFIFMACLLAGMSAARAANQAGRILDREEPPEKCRGRTPEMPLENIYRVNSSPALRMKPLYLDDELRIEGTPGCFLEVRIGVEIKILHTADSPFSITERSIRQAPSLWDRLLASLTGGPKQRSVTAGFVNRGGI
ncbi:MAG: hypothetical protein GY862_05030 [Gammaproteobacteria bacterium]|nr:hypothetical protein [Gammaproteobacteria bacterium]